MTPAIVAVKAATKTAPAEMSLAILAAGWCSLVNPSTTVSIAVLVNSTVITNPIKIVIITQSIIEIFKNKPSMITNNPAKR